MKPVALLCRRYAHGLHWLSAHSLTEDGHEVGRGANMRRQRSERITPRRAPAAQADAALTIRGIIIEGLKSLSCRAGEIGRIRNIPTNAAVSRVLMPRTRLKRASSLRDREHTRARARDRTNNGLHGRVALSRIALEGANNLAAVSRKQLENFRLRQP
eukprot:scaffold80848_cov30-Tisochrysis_lutea.AAC.7